VAIKIINKDKIYDFSDRQRLNLEIQILKNTYHYNLIKIYQVIETPNTVCMIMEYAEGGELFDYIIKNEYLSEDESRNIFHQIIDAIDYMHQLGICHRDLKPENILFDSSHKNIKIIDFGLSNLYYTDLSIINDEQTSFEASDVELLETPCGSPGYAPPEMVLGYCYNGLLTDIWSSGIILFAMLCGSFPFDDDSEQILYSKIIKGKYEFPKEIIISEEAKNLIKKILVVNPDYRATIDDIKNDPWFKKDYKPIYGLCLPIQEIPTDDYIIREIEKKGYSKDEIIKNIKNNRHNEITTFYYLLVKKNSRNGIDSVNNLISPSFTKYILEENEKNKDLKDRKISINLKLIFEKLNLEEEERIEKSRKQNINTNINKDETNYLKKEKENEDNNIKNINDNTNIENKKENKEILDYTNKSKPKKDKSMEVINKKQELNKNNGTNKNINNTNMSRAKEEQLKNFKNNILGIKDKKFKKLKKLNKIIDKKLIYQYRFKKLNNLKRIINYQNIREITHSINFTKDAIINLSFPYNEGDLNNILASSMKKEKYIFQGRIKTDRANYDKYKHTLKTLIKKEAIPLYQKFKLNCNETKQSHKKNNKSNYHYINKVVKNSKTSSFNVYYMNKSIKLKNINQKINNTNYKNISSKTSTTKNISVHKEKENMSYRYLNKNKNLLESNLSRILNHSEAKSSSNSKSREKNKLQNYSQLFNSTRNKNIKNEQNLKHSEENSENNFCYKKINKFRIESKERIINNLKLNSNKSNDNNINFSININLNLNQIKNLKEKGISFEQNKHKKLVKSLKGIKLDLKNINNNYPTYNGNSVINSEKNNNGSSFKLKKDIFLNQKKYLIKISKNKKNYLNKLVKNESHSKEKKFKKINLSFKKQKSFQSHKKKKNSFTNSLSKILPFLKSMNRMKIKSQKKTSHNNINIQNDNSKIGNTFSNKSNSIINNKVKINLNQNEKIQNQKIMQIKNKQKLLNNKNIKNWNNSYNIEVPLTKNKTLDQSKFNYKKSPIMMKMKPLNLKGFIKSNNNNPYSYKSLTMRGDKSNIDILVVKDELYTSRNKTLNNNQDKYVIKKIQKNEKFINNDAIFDLSPLKIKDILLNQLPINNIFITQKSSKDNYFIFHCFKGKLKLIIELLQIKENNFIFLKIKCFSGNQKEFVSIRKKILGIINNIKNSN